MLIDKSFLSGFTAGRGATEVLPLSAKGLERFSRLQFSSRVSEISLSLSPTYSGGRRPSRPIAETNGDGFGVPVHSSLCWPVAEVQALLNTGFGVVSTIDLGITLRGEKKRWKKVNENLTIIRF